MPHQCVKCKTDYEDGSSTILNGCQCGGKFFFLYKKEDMKDEIKKLSYEQLHEIEGDLREIIDAPISGRPVVLDFESVRILEPGKFEIDLVNLMKGDSVVYKLKEGKYIIDIASTFQLAGKKSSKRFR